MFYTLHYGWSAKFLTNSRPVPANRARSVTQRSGSNAKICAVTHCAKANKHVAHLMSGFCHLRTQYVTYVANLKSHFPLPVGNDGEGSVPSACAVDTARDFGPGPPQRQRASGAAGRQQDRLPHYPHLAHIKGDPSLSYTFSSVTHYTV